MFQVEDGAPSPAMQQAVASAEKSYVVRPNDLLDIRVFTNKGEVLIDPTGNLVKEMGSPTASTQNTRPEYLVSPAGTVNLPMVGVVTLSGLTLNQADSTLQIAYHQYYEESFVVTKILNKRVTVLGAPGGKVIPLTTPDMTLLEVLALSGGLTNQFSNGNATNIRIIRGDLKNPTVLVIDLTTIEGMMKADLAMQPNDVIYIEPIRVVISETLRELAPLTSLVLSAITTVLLYWRVTN